MNTAPQVNAVQSRLLARFTTVRGAAFALDLFIGAAFAREASAEWNSRGFAGLASACFNLRGAIANVAGACDLHEEAGLLAAQCAAQ